MKELLTLLLLLPFIIGFGQTKECREEFMSLKPDVRLGIWDKENSDKRFSIDTISYDEIPKYLEFRGTVVEALKWTDVLGENILIQTVTGQFDWKKYYSDSSKYDINEKSELYAYLFRREGAKSEFKRVWKVYDYRECFGVDWFTGFVTKATTITDADTDGITEVTMPYITICRGGVDPPGDLKIIMYENDVKYALTGSAMLFCDETELGIRPYGGEFEPNENLKHNEVLMDFIIQSWEAHKCESRIFH